MVCGKCALALPTDGDYVLCSGCQKEYHYGKNCAGLKKASYLSKSEKAKRDWLCAYCREAKKTDTPSDTQSAFNFDETSIRDIIESILEEFKSELRDSLKSVSDELKTLNNNISTEINGLKESIQVLKNRNVEQDAIINSLQQQIVSLDQYGRNKNFEIANVEEVQDESVEGIVLSLAEKLNIVISADDIDAAHRLPSRNNSRPPSIIVQLTSRKKRDQFVNKKKQVAALSSKDLVGGTSTQRLHVNENLCPHFRTLMYNTKVLAKEKGFKFVWYKFGKILVRKEEKCNNVLKIFNFDDLSKLRSVNTQDQAVLVNT